MDLRSSCGWSGFGGARCERVATGIVVIELMWVVDEGTSSMAPIKSSLSSSILNGAVLKTASSQNYWSLIETRAGPPTTNPVRGLWSVAS